MLDLKSQMKNPPPLAITASRYEFYDDWGDNCLTNRRYGGNATISISDTVYECKNFRPEWTTESGSPSASGGVLVLTAGDATSQQISTPSDFTTGTWEADFYYTDSPSTGNTSLFPMVEDKQNEDYQIAIRTDDYDLGKHSGGSYTRVIDTSTSSSVGDWHTCKATRDSDGNWELFHDGTSVGTATDTYLPSVKTLWHTNAHDVEIHWDNLRVY